ncbi:unnamed protein product [Malus baccata var. baccata]
MKSRRDKNNGSYKPSNLVLQINLQYSLSLPSHPSISPTHFLPIPFQKKTLHPICAADSGKSSVVAEKPPKSASAPMKPVFGKWSLDSWKSKKALQLPEYPDVNELETVLKTIESFPPIIFKEFSANNIRDTFRIMLQMGVVLMFGGQMPVIKVGRMAGQFAKPRSAEFEEKDGVKLPIYKGDNINGDAFDEKNRNPDPQRYQELATRVDEALGFMNAAGLTVDHPIMTTTYFWTSHECLHLPYEQSLTRLDSTSGLYYNCSAHMLWVGERTWQLDGAHVEFLRGLANPIGIKVGFCELPANLRSNKMDPKDLVNIIEILNPSNKPEMITIIARMGAENMRIKLSHLIRDVRQAGQIVTLVSDPMHGNTIQAPCGLKARPFDSILAEVRAFFDVHEQEGSHPGGIHLEMTGQNVTECIGGSRTVTLDDLSSRYHMHCDPRLNASQALELSFIIAERLRKRRMGTQSLLSLGGL